MKWHIMKLDFKEIKRCPYNGAHLLIEFIQTQDTLASFFKADVTTNDTSISSCIFERQSENVFRIKQLDPTLLDNFLQASDLQIELSELQLKKYQLISAMSSRNGFERETALVNANFSDYLDDDDILNALLLRLNDWVEPIRVLTKTIMTEWLNKCSLLFLIEHFHSFVKMKNCQRANHEALIDFVESKLVCHKPILLKALMSINYKAAFSSYTIIEKHKLLSDDELLDIAHLIKNVVIVRKLRPALLNVSKHRFIALLPNIQKIKASDIAVVKLKLCVKYRIDTEVNIKLHLLHHSRSVHETAYHLANQFNLNPISIYENILNKHHDYPQRSILTILKMSHVIEKIDNIESYLSCLITQSHHPKVRMNALFLLLNYDPKMAHDIVMQCCLSDNLDAVNFAIKYLSKKKLYCNIDKLIHYILTAQTIEAKKALISKIAIQNSQWDTLFAYLKLYDHMEPDTFKKLDLNNNLIAHKIDFRSIDKHEPVLNDWLKNNKGCLNNEIIAMLNNSYHGKIYLATLLDQALIPKDKKASSFWGKCTTFFKKRSQS